MGGQYCLTEEQAGCDGGDEIGVMYEEESDGIESRIISACEVFCSSPFCFWQFWAFCVGGSVFFIACAFCFARMKQKEADLVRPFEEPE